MVFTQEVLVNITSCLVSVFFGFAVHHLARQGGGPRAPVLRQRNQLSQLWQRPGAAQWRGRGVEGLVVTCGFTNIINIH